MADRLVVFAREPRLGRVKRRLAAGIGAVAAWRFFRTQMNALVRRLRGDGRWRLELGVTPDAATARFPWPIHPVRGQGGGDLGARMARTLARGGRVVLVGSDVPGIRTQHIAAAFHLLGRCDMVLGPADDGGYWLIGVRGRRRWPRGALHGVRWSTESALADTLASFPRAWTVGFAACLADVDDAAAFYRWRKR